MSDKPETLAAIIAEMHAELDCIDDTKVIPVVYIKNRLPRIEAAAERERIAHTNDIHDALYKATGIPGNAAAMRAALERIVNLAPEYPARGVDWNALAADAFLTASAALDAPARNCDRFATELDARLAWKRETKCKGDYRYWLFVPAEGGDHA